MLGRADAIILDDEITAIVGVMQAHEDRLRLCVPDDVRERFLHDRVGHVLDRGHAGWLVATHDEICPDARGACCVSQQRSHRAREVAALAAGPRQREHDVTHLIGHAIQVLAHVLQLCGSRRLEASLEQGTQPHADREDTLLDVIVQPRGDVFSLVAEQLFALDVVEPLMKLLQAFDHRPLPLVEPGVVDRTAT